MTRMKPFCRWAVEIFPDDWEVEDTREEARETAASWLVYDGKPRRVRRVEIREVAPTRPTRAGRTR